MPVTLPYKVVYRNKKTTSIEKNVQNEKIGHRLAIFGHTRQRPFALKAVVG
jgi:hypothetical protein